jgi:hypothetical protein
MYWESIRETLLYNDVPTAQATEENMKVILANMLSGNIHVWVIYENEDGKELVKTLIITSFIYDPVTFTKNLLVYNIYGYSFAVMDLWKDALESLRKFAQAERCNKIVGYSCLPQVKTLVEKLGGNCNTFLVQLEV